MKAMPASKTILLVSVCLVLFMGTFGLNQMSPSVVAANQMESPTATPFTLPTEDIFVPGIPTPTSDIPLGRTYTETEYVPAVLPIELVPELERTLAEAVSQEIAAFSIENDNNINGRSVIALRSLKFDGRVITLDLTNSTDLGESQWGELLHTIDLKVTDILYQSSGLQGLNLEYYILLDGEPLEEMLPQSEIPEGSESLLPNASQSIDGIQGQKIVLSPGHGYFTKFSGGWYLQRGYYFGIVEDFINPDLVVDLNRFVIASGGNPRPTRQINKSAGNHSSGYAWWQMGASEYLRSLGAPESVWKPLPYSTNYDHDTAARPEYANWIGASSMVSIHNNGSGSANCNGHGTEIWYDTSNGYQKQSLALAQAIHGKLIQRIRERWDANWCDRGLKSSNGGYGENRRFRGPAVIVELAFMDVQSDNAALQNPTFRAIAMAAINEGLVQYYGGVSCPTITGWKGEYWNNRSLNGYAVMCRNDNSVNFNWGTGGPGGSVLNDQFSARWTRTINLSAGNYRFHVRGDDGIRLWIDNNLVIDKWFDQGATEYTVDRNLSAGNHSFKIEYYENGGGAVAQFWYEPIGVSCPTITAWKGEYWNNRYLSGNPVLCRNDSNVNFNWGTGGPGSGVPNDKFSARWTRTIPFSAGRYKFHLKGDDGIRLWIDGALVIDKWFDQGATEYTVLRNLSAGNHTLKVEYYENGGNALVQLWWELHSLALNRPTWATSQQSSSYPPSKGNDGNIGTRWSSRGSSTNANEWWRVDVGSGQTFDRVVIRWEAAYAARHFVGWSNDGANFTGYWYNISGAGNYAYNIGSRTARYVAVLSTQHAPCCNNYSLWEFEVYRTIVTSMASTNDEEIAVEIAGTISDTTTIPTTLLEEIQNGVPITVENTDMLSNTVTLQPISELVTIQAPAVMDKHIIFSPVILVQK